MNLTLVDIIGHVCMGFLLMGKWNVAHRRRSGWLYWAVGATGLVGVGVALGMTSIALWNAAYVAFYLYSWRLWGRDGKNV